LSLRPEVVIKASMRATDVLEGMGYIGKHGAIKLVKLNLQTNTVTAILHNMIAWQIGKLDKRWTFKPKGGGTPDLVDAEGHGIQVKVASGAKIIGNRVSVGKGYYVAVKYKRKGQGVVIAEIRMGELESEDWDRRKGTQFAFLRPEGEAKLRKIYP